MQYILNTIIDKVPENSIHLYSRSIDFTMEDYSVPELNFELHIYITEDNKMVFKGVYQKSRFVIRGSNYKEMILISEESIKTINDIMLLYDSLFMPDGNIPFDRFSISRCLRYFSLFDIFGNQKMKSVLTDRNINVFVDISILSKLKNLMRFNPESKEIEFKKLIRELNDKIIKLEIDRISTFISNEKGIIEIIKKYIFDS